MASSVIKKPISITTITRTTDNEGNTYDPIDIRRIISAYVINIPAFCFIRKEISEDHFATRFHIANYDADLSPIRNTEVIINILSQ